MSNINTVLGPIAPEKLGLTLAHEHISAGYAGGNVTLYPGPTTGTRSSKSALKWPSP